jgi:GT2 family glycosyltransferase
VSGVTVSVVVPTYYRVDDLSGLFDSLLRQTVKPFEVIAVDDTPDDVIRALCEEYEPMFESVGSKLFYVRNPGARSLTISRNVGVKLAGGELIMLLDSDVILHQNYIEKIMEVFRKYPDALGVQGWITNFEKGNVPRFIQILNKVFFLGQSAKNSCKFFEYPVVLTKIINCERLSGANMTFKREVFDKFKFDENLQKYSYMEDVLFSHSIFKKHPKGLFITPYAKCVHKSSEAGRVESEELKRLSNEYSKYVLIKLFGSKGALLYFWQNVGTTIKLKGRAFRKRLPSNSRPGKV